MRALCMLVALAAPMMTAGCGGSDEEERDDQQPRIPLTGRTRVQVTGETVWVYRGGVRWRLPERASEIALSPQKTRYAAMAPEGDRLIVRDLRARALSRVPLAAPVTMPNVVWLDERRLLLPDPGAADGETIQASYSIRDAQSGRLLGRRAGSNFAWDVGHRRLAYIAKLPASDAERVMIDDKAVWPRPPAGPRASSVTPVAAPGGAAERQVSIAGGSGATRGGVLTGPLVAPGASTHIRGPLAWAPAEPGHTAGHAVAFVELGATGARLVVLLEVDDPSGDLTWPVPREALEPGLRVWWVSGSRVVIGDDPMRPRFSADWQRLQ